MSNRIVLTAFVIAAAFCSSGLTSFQAHAEDAYYIMNGTGCCLGACPFNRFGPTCGEYDSAKGSIRSLGFYASPPGWHA
jgi:hypothetical protein